LLIPLTLIFTPSASKAAQNNGYSLVPKILNAHGQQVLVENPEGKSIWKNLDVDGRTVEWILKE